MWWREETSLSISGESDCFAGRGNGISSRLSFVGRFVLFGLVRARARARAMECEGL